MKKLLLTAIATCCIFLLNGVSQPPVKIAFYNVENLFDIYDDPQKQDEEFLPGGIKGWNYRRYQRKLRHLYKTILAMEEGSRIAAIGLCELENCFVTRQLLERTPLSGRRFRFIQYESPDRRGVDVALLYDPTLLTPIASRPIAIRFPFDTLGRTRDILYVKALIHRKDTLHLFINHWPSRFGGLLATIPKRNHVAQILRTLCDSILCRTPSAHLVLMGDFNDNPDDESIRLHLMTGKHPLVNLMDKPHWQELHGTLKHGAIWNLFDQIIVSDAFFQPQTDLLIVGARAHLYDAPFLFTEDPKFPGKKLFRTYNGMNYLGGFGDHLPVFIEVTTRPEGR
ncbi:MAG: endonuclease [Bacteroidetes bacterium]|nr:MAG: endonuclease [Bacteroidota bacterium]